MKRFIAAIALFFWPMSVLADNHEFSNGEAVSLQPDRAYILVRTFQEKGMFAPVLARELSDAELSDAEAAAAAGHGQTANPVESNVVEPFADKPYATLGNEEYLLISVKPGTYVLSGLAVTSWALVSAGLMTTSLAMGTVKFEAKPGVITDMGAIVGAQDDQPTEIPELANVVAGRPIGDAVRPRTLALRPTALEVPAALEPLARSPADYHAVGYLPNFSGAGLSRLAPLPGVLDYDKDGNVLDLKAGGAILH